jgi:3-hydroxymyristoyl/3-hydroxydecanoyl-(acyl carrier protein) dehydratase
VKIPLVNAADLKATIAIPASGPWFEGHFPGRPILPGVAELALAIATLGRETGSNCRPVKAPPGRAKRRACAST